MMDRMECALLAACMWPPRRAVSTSSRMPHPCLLPVIFLCVARKSTYGVRNIGNFHGTGAFNLTEYGTWDSILVDMLGRPSAVVVLKLGNNGRRKGGWSENNPYLEEVRK